MNDAPKRSPLVPLLALGAIATAASAALVSQRLGALDLPGCGLEGACARAANSVWGTLPVVDWPLSYVGLAYALALIVAVLAGRGRLAAPALWVVRIGAVGSVLLSAVMVVEGYVCPYCLVFHGAHVLAWLLLERAARGGAPTEGDAWMGAAGTFAVVTALLALVDVRFREVAEQRGEEELARSTEAILEGTDEPPALTGRYRIGPAEAAIRVVIFSDYQCPDCRRIEQEMRRVLERRSDVSFSPKHFPFCADCNDRFAELGTNPHPNACWAARAAEAAGILGGTEAFHRMHRWLFDRRGGFTNAELRTGLAEMGFDAVEFETTMKSEETLARVRADIEEAVGYGLHHTPMIFVNGVELKGWHAKDALIRTVEAVAASKPAPATAAQAGDRAPSALERHLSDWREQPRKELRVEPRHRWFGAAEPGDSPPTDVVVWGDYREPGTNELDARLRAAVAERPGVRYSFRHYPFDEACNPNVPRTEHPEACFASRAAEAAGQMGDDEAYWKLHAWLMENPEPLDEDALRAAAERCGLDPGGLFARMESPSVAAAIAKDVRDGKALGLKALPFLYVDGRFVPRWNLKGERVPEKILAEAAAAAAQ